MAWQSDKLRAIIHSSLRQIEYVVLAAQVEHLLFHQVTVLL